MDSGILVKQFWFSVYCICIIMNWFILRTTILVFITMAFSLKTNGRSFYVDWEIRDISSKRTDCRTFSFRGNCYFIRFSIINGKLSLKLCRKQAAQQPNPPEVANNVLPNQTISSRSLQVTVSKDGANYQMMTGSSCGYQHWGPISWENNAEAVIFHII